MWKKFRAYWATNMWPKMVIFYIVALLTMAALSVTMIIKAEGHGTHQKGGTGPLIYQRALPAGMYLQGNDLDGSGKVDRLRIVAVHRNAFHILTEFKNCAEYNAFIKKAEYDDHWKIDPELCD